MTNFTSSTSVKVLQCGKTKHGGHTGFCTPQQPDQREKLATARARGRKWSLGCGGNMLKKQNIVYTSTPWEYYCGKRETMHTPSAYHNQNDPKDTCSPFYKQGRKIYLCLTIKEYAFTSPFPMQRNPPQIVKWHPGASTQLGQDMHWGLLMSQNRTIQWHIFAGPFFPVHSQKKLDIKRPYCTSCQDQIDRLLIWQGPLQKKWKRPKHWTLWDPICEHRTIPPHIPFISLIKARSPKKPVFTWENVSRWQVSTWL